MKKIKYSADGRKKDKIKKSKIWKSVTEWEKRANVWKNSLKVKYKYLVIVGLKTIK